MRLRLLVGVLASVCAGLGACKSAQQNTIIPAGGDVVNPMVSTDGEWVLGTSPDSSVYVGAQSVELTLQPTTFSIVARYPGEAPLTISGDVTRSTDGGLQLTLTPRTVSHGNGAITHPTPFTVNKPMTVMASAVGRTLVFTLPDRTDPTSVWHRKTSDTSK